MLVWGEVWTLRHGHTVALKLVSIKHFAISIKHSQLLIVTGYYRVELALSLNWGYYHIIYLVVRAVGVLVFDAVVFGHVAVEDIFAGAPQVRTLHMQVRYSLSMSGILLKELFTLFSDSLNVLPN